MQGRRKPSSKVNPHEAISPTKCQNMTASASRYDGGTASAARQSVGQHSSASAHKHLNEICAPVQHGQQAAYNEAAAVPSTDEVLEDLEPVKCPSPPQLSPRNLQHKTSLDDCSPDQCSNSSKPQTAYSGTVPSLDMPHQQQHQQQHCSLPSPVQQLEAAAYSPAAANPLQPLAHMLNSSNSNHHSSTHYGQLDTSAGRDDMLMDFWALLQQTQQNLQDMLVDLETAKIELDLANNRADEAELVTNALKVQLAAAQQRGSALEGQLQHMHAKETDASARTATLTQRNAELSTQVYQAQRAAAALELKVERLQMQLAAAAAAAAAASPVAAAQEAAAAAAAAHALVTQLKSELSQTRSELAATQSRAARAELELAVAKTKTLIAQQEATASMDRCRKLESEITSLSQQLGAAAATAEVAAADRHRLEQQVELLSAKLEQKDNKLRNSMSAMARASSNLRASFSAQGGVFDPEVLRSSTTLVADMVRKSSDIRSLLRSSQQQQQQRYGTVPEGCEVGTAAGSSSSSSNNTVEIQQQESNVLVDASRLPSPFAAVMPKTDSVAVTHSKQPITDKQHTMLEASALAADRMNDTAIASPVQTSSPVGCATAAVIDWQSPIFKKRDSAAGRSSSSSSSGSRRSSAAGSVTPRSMGKAAGLPPRPTRTSSSGLSSRGSSSGGGSSSSGGGSRSLNATPRLEACLSPAGSCTSDLSSPVVSRRSSSISSSSGECSSAAATAAKMPCGVLYVPSSSSSSSGKHSSSSSSSGRCTAGCCYVCSHGLSNTAGATCSACPSTLQPTPAADQIAAASAAASRGLAAATTTTAAAAAAAAMVQGCAASTRALAVTIPSDSEVLISRKMSLLLPVPSSPRSPMGMQPQSPSRHTCRITQFAAAGPCAAASSSNSDSSSGVVDAAVTAWEAQHPAVDAAVSVPQATAESSTTEATSQTAAAAAAGVNTSTNSLSSDLTHPSAAAVHGAGTLAATATEKASSLMTSRLTASTGGGDNSSSAAGDRQLAASSTDDASSSMITRLTASTDGGDSSSAVGDRQLSAGGLSTLVAASPTAAAAAAACIDVGAEANGSEVPESSRSALVAEVIATGSSKQCKYSPESHSLASDGSSMTTGLTAAVAAAAEAGLVTVDQLLAVKTTAYSVPRWLLAVAYRQWLPAGSVAVAAVLGGSGLLHQQQRRKKQQQQQQL